MELYHQHLLIKAFVKNPPTQETVLNYWLESLVADIKMKVVVPARSKYVDAVGNRGLTGAVNIETSHIAVHIWDEPVPAHIEMDVYSCSKFDIQTVFNKLCDFGLVKYHFMLIDRNGDTFKVVKQSDGFIS
ncbi:MAG: S-adenosylmethionine decarboxylase [Proteobacteria bacterium]|nr:S-adenosylmethionine decarboxylase [Pseudomonadota bacterium]